MTLYVVPRDLPQQIRMPLRGCIDLTYRCNNYCRHCWLWLPADADEMRNELSYDEIKRIAEEARNLGTREWDISGGEAMLRPDFPELFDYLTKKFRTYTLRTNGTLITPKIARLMKRPGAKWISLYGATPEVYDSVTRNPGGFEKLMRGFALLKENGVKFTVQLFPMRENWHQWPKMMELARSISSECRIGAVWLHLSAGGNRRRNKEIMAQRLDPADVIMLDPPPMDDNDKVLSAGESCQHPSGDKKLFASCINSAKQFHVDAYGQMSFCEIIKDPSLRYDLRKGTVREGWEIFLPSIAKKVRGSEKYREGCGKCEIREDCRWCASYAWLEHGDYSEKIDFLCKIAEEKRKYKENWQINHRRYFAVAEVTIQVDSDLPISDSTFASAVSTFATDGPGENTVRIRHHFSLEGLALNNLGQEVYHEDPWTIYRKNGSWIYRCGLGNVIFCIATFSADHSRGRIYHATDDPWFKGNLNTLSLPPTDQILLVRLMAERQGLILHSAGVIFESKGLIFVGHSDAGKTTTTRLLEGYAEILCDDRNIVRRFKDGFHLYGTWSHGDSQAVSSLSAPLHAVIFLKQSQENRLTRLIDTRSIIHRLLPCLVRGATDQEWWGKTLDMAAALACEVPCYEMEFDKSGEIVSLLQRL